MLKTQSTFRGTLNSVWAEKARISAKASVVEQLKRARGNLFGRLKHLSTIGETPLKSGKPRLINFPEEWSEILDGHDVIAMQDLADSMNFAGAMELFRKIETGVQVSALSNTQQMALLVMLDGVKERYGCPVWKTQDSIVQLHLDFRCMGGREAQNALLERLDSLVLPNEASKLKTVTSVPFLVSGVVARATPLKFNAVVRSNVLESLINSASNAVHFTSLVLEIGPTETVVKGILSQKPQPFTLAEAKCLLGNDFGFVNTASAVVVEKDRLIDEEWLASTADWTKTQAREYLETHSHDGSAIEEVMFNGRHFLDRVKVHSQHIDRLRSDINRNYARMERLKYEINRELGQPLDTRIEALEYGSKRSMELTGRFMKLLGAVAHLKMLRRQVYRSIDGLKKSWFGFVTTRLVQMCVKHKAGYVREDLTILAKEKKDPEYKGRTFNKMMNNGAKGQFLQRMSDKLKWWGVPEVILPSYYTSSTDVRYSVVDGKQRKGEVFTARRDGRKMHADLHAGLTLALWPLLRCNTPGKLDLVNVNVNLVTNIDVLREDLPSRTEAPPSGECSRVETAIQ
jgi:hypothetical protein